MADDDSRRGVSADADSPPSDNNSENPQTAEEPTVDSVASQSNEKLSADKPKNNSNEETQKVEAVISASRDSEETRNRLAKAREELNRAREESARARDEVEKAKKDLAVAKQDTVPSSQAEAQEEKQPAEEISVTSESTSQVEMTNEVSVKNSQELDTPANDVANLQHETAQPEPPKEVMHEDSEESNQNVQSTAAAAEEVESSTPAACESQSAVDSEPVDQVAKVDTPDTTSESAASEVPKEMNASPEKLEESQSGECELPEGQEKEAADSKAEEGELEGDEDDQVEEDEHGDAVIVEGEREEGDGEESGEEGAPAKPLDDDEDRRNPQYIPKRGGFYEHDDRTREEGEEAAPEEPEVEEKPKKNRSEAIDRWGHDMFDPNQQGPKSDQELVDLYGYDIRQEEGAPRARRRRRYGRGPNKYDRTWEDEDAYSRPRGRGGPAGATRGGPSERGGGDRNQTVRPRTQRQEVPRKDDFPALSDHRQDPKSQAENTSNSSSANWRDAERGDMGDRRGGSSKANAISFRRGGGGRTFEEPKKSKGTNNRAENASQPGDGDEDHGSDNMKSPRRPQGDVPSRGGSTRGHRGGATGYAGPPPRGAGASPRGRGAAPSFRGRGRNGDNSNWNKEEEGPGRTGPQGFARGPDRAPHNVNMDHRGPFEEPKGRGRGKFGRSMDADQVVVGGMEQMRIEDRSAPSRNQDAGRSKRYSSQRQRMTTPPPANSGAPIQQPPYPVAAAGGGSTAYYASYNDSPPPNYVSTAPAPLLPMAVAAQGAPPAYMAQPMYPAGPGPATFNAGPYYPPAAAPPTVPVGVPIGSPTQDNMYGGGIMYYDPGRQPIRHGTQPTRRAKAAIPIVAPDNDVDSYLMSGRRPNHD